MKFVCIGLLIFSGLASASQDYLCEINRVISAEKALEASGKNYNDIYLGKRFTVNRLTGETRGALDNNYKRPPIVVDSGDEKNGFKVVASMYLHEGAGAGTDIQALTVMEFLPQKKKPFVYLLNSDVFFGTCEKL